MKLAAVTGLATVAVPSPPAVPGAPGVPAIWYRAVPAAFAATPLATAHSTGRRNRYNPGPRAKTPFALLYLAEDMVTALLEVRALFGSPASPAGLIVNPRVHYVVFSVRVSLSAVVDLTATRSHAALATTAQELTGDLDGYATRALTTSSIPAPVGKAPTQELGEALDRHGASATPPPVEGWLTISARVPYHRVLVIRNPAGLPPSALRVTGRAGPTQGVP
jgi:hypothetical protein